ncbi:hypothetical protein [Streptomyces sp. NPDC093514]
MAAKPMLPAVKETAYARRQMLFHLFLCEDGSGRLLRGGRHG